MLHSAGDWGVHSAGTGSSVGNGLGGRAGEKKLKAFGVVRDRNLRWNSKQGKERRVRIWEEKGKDKLHMQIISLYTWYISFSLVVMIVKPAMNSSSLFLRNASCSRRLLSRSEVTLSNSPTRARYASSYIQHRKIDCYQDSRWNVNSAGFRHSSAEHAL